MQEKMLKLHNAYINLYRNYQIMDDLKQRSVFAVCVIRMLELLKRSVYGSEGQLYYMLGFDGCFITNNEGKEAEEEDFEDMEYDDFFHEGIAKYFTETFARTPELFKGCFRPIELLDFDLYQYDDDEVLRKEASESYIDDSNFSVEDSVAVFNEMETTYDLFCDDAYYGDLEVIKSDVLENFLDNHDKSLEETDSYRNLMMAISILETNPTVRGKDSNIYCFVYENPTICNGTSVMHYRYDDCVMRFDFGLMLVADVIRNSLKELGVTW